MDVASNVLCRLQQNPSYVDDLQEQTHRLVQGIDHIGDPISYTDFFEQYLLANRACILGSWVTANWKSREEWVTKDGHPDVLFLKNHFGEDTGPVADCNQEKFSSHPKQNMTVAEFVKYLTDRKGEHSPSSPCPCLYLKDWHFQRSHPEYQAYITPELFQSDWLNEFWDQRSDGQADDYRFVYFGPKGSWTPLHTDVFKSYSWSANICGRKKWVLFPPGEEDCLRDCFGQVAFDLTATEISDRKKYPRYDQLHRRFEVIQEAGEVIFVPSGWYHQVFNMEDTISINHNWMNACNAALCWRYIRSCLQDVQREIRDCQDMEGWGDQCQLMLRATAGINYAEFFHFLHVIGTRRVQVVEKVCHQRVCSKSSLPERCECIQTIQCLKCTARQLPDSQDGHTDKSDTAGGTSHLNDIVSSPCSGLGSLAHCVFDLLLVQRLLEDMLQCKEFQDLDWSTLVGNPWDFCQLVKSAVQSGIQSLENLPAS